MSEFEIVQYGQIEGMSIFFNAVEYRTSHFHQDWELLMGLDNKLKISSESGSFIVGRGDFVLFPPGMVHELQAEHEPATFLCLQISPSFAGLEENFGISDLKLSDFFSQPELNSMRKMLLDIFESYIVKLPFYKTFCTGNCNLLMYRILKKVPGRTKTEEEMDIQSRKNERLTRLIEYVNENYMHKITLNEFARREGLTMNYTSHFVKESLGKSFQSYVNTVRFHAACKLINAGSCKMKDVYREVGFSDYKYFSNTFKSYFSTTPDGYARRVDGTNAVRPILNQSINSSEKRLSTDESLALLFKERRML